MMAAGLVGLTAGLLPRAKPKWAQLTILICFAAVAAYTYGALMTMWNWPFLAGENTSLSFMPGAGILENLNTFVKFEIFTGGLLWDTGRAVTTCVLIALTAPALLPTLRRAANRAGFEKL
jgi:energy-coupling factor transport system substrate-specific component